MRKTIAITLMFWGVLAFAPQSHAATSDTITVTVSLEEVVSVSLNNSAWIIGSIALSGSSAAPSNTATNDGNVAIDLDIKATDGAGGWTLAASAGADAFSVDVTSPAISLSALDQSLATNVAASGTKSIDLTYNAPTSDTAGGGVDQGFTVTITATKYVP